MGRPRIMLDVRIFHNAKFGALSNRAKLGWIYLLCEAKQQDREGVFPSRPIFLLGAGQFRDCAATWLEQGLVHYLPTSCPKCSVAYADVSLSAVVVHDWHDYQPSRTTLWREENGVGKEGLKRLRNIGETPSETPGETSVKPEVKPLARATRASVSLSSSSSETEGVQGEPENDRDCLDTYYELTRYRPWGIWSGEKLTAAANEYGDANVSAALRSEMTVDPTVKTLLDRTLARLARDAEKARRSKPQRPRIVRPVIDPAAKSAVIRELMKPEATSA